MKILVNQFARSFSSSLLCSFSQIMLQKNAATGLLFIVAIGMSSPIMLLGSTIAVLSALFVAQLLQYEPEAIHSGLYGYNAALAGAAIFLFLPVSLFSLMLVFFVGAMSTFIMRFLLVKLPNFPVFTVPFLVSIWLVLLAIEILAIDINQIPFTGYALGDFYTVMRGIGQVMFQGFWLSGLFIIVGLFLHSYKVAIWSFIGSILGVVIAYFFSFPEELIQQGLYGFNASLSAIALAQRFNKANWPIIIGIILSTILTRYFELLALPALTAPFVLASWMVMVLVRTEST